MKPGRRGLVVALFCLAATAGQSQVPAPVPGSASEPAAGPAVAQPPPPGVTWSQFSGWKRYHANCATCHGPDGMGGTFAPSLVNSLKSVDQDAFMDVVVNGKQNSQLAMPSFGADPNVMCYIEDIYAYLKLRSDGALPRGRPVSPPAKPKDFAEAEAACMGV